MPHENRGPLGSPQEPIGAPSLHDLHARGWLHWRRYLVLPPGQDREELAAAAELFVPCFLAGFGEIPDPLLRLVASQPAALDALHELVEAPDPAARGTAVARLQLVVDATEDDAAAWAMFALCFAEALAARFQLTGDLSDLERSAEVLRRAVQRVVPGHPRSVDILRNLAEILSALYEVTGLARHLAEALGVLRFGVGLTSLDLPRQAELLVLMGSVVLIGGHTGPDADPEDPVACLRALPVEVVDDSCLTGFRFAVGLALRKRYDQNGDGSDLEAAVSHFRAVVGTVGDGHPSRAPVLYGLGSALLARFGLTDDAECLNEAVAVLRVSAAAEEHATPELRETLGELATALRARSVLRPTQSDLEEAITVGLALLELTPQTGPERAVVLAGIGVSYMGLLECTDDRRFLDGAIDHYRAAAENVSEHPTFQYGFEHMLLTALRERFERAGDRGDLNEAVSLVPGSPHSVPAQLANRAEVLSDFALLLMRRHEYTSERADVERAITFLEAAVEAAAGDPVRRSGCLSDLCLTVKERFVHTRDLADIDRAVSFGRAALAALPAGHRRQAMYMMNLALARHIRAELTADHAELDAVITDLREAASIAPDDPALQAQILTNLTGALVDRYQLLWGVADLAEAGSRALAAVEVIPEKHPRRPGMLCNLGITAVMRYERFGHRPDLDNAVVIGQAAVDELPPGHRDRGEYLSALGGMLGRRLEGFGDPADLDRAVECFREAVRTTLHREALSHSAALSGLGTMLSKRFRFAKDPADLDEAIGLFDRALETATDDSFELVLHRLNRAQALCERFLLTGQHQDLEAAASACELAWSTTGSPARRIRAAGLAAELLAGVAPARAAEAAEVAVRLMPLTAPRQLGRAERQYALADLGGLAADAVVYTLADTSRPRRKRAARALSLLETGRGVLLGQFLDTRSDLTDLRFHHRDLAARFVRLRDGLDRMAAPELSWSRPTVDATTPDRHRAARDFEAVLSEIRSLDGFHAFGQPPSAEDLQAEAEEGPIVVLTVSARRSDALLLTDQGIDVLELPDLTADALQARAADLGDALDKATTGTTPEERTRIQPVLTDLMGWLWDVVTGPVLTTLGHTRQPGPGEAWPRVWWVAGGLLGMLPLHAAGHHSDEPDDPHRRTVLDRVVSSYTPTVRALRYARARATPHPGPPRGLVVAMPTTPDLPDGTRLAHVGGEADLVCRHLGDAVLLREPAPSGRANPGEPSVGTPTKAAVLSLLPSVAIAHFACHGSAHPTDPSRSMLLLHDHVDDPLTVGSLDSVHLDDVRLAYLSACRTAAAGSAWLLDESVNLTSAFQLAGFPSVVGTLWEINDQASKTVADSFYTHLRGPDGLIDTGRAAWAIHQAVRDLRDGRDLPGPYDRVKVPHLWAAFLHAGA
ncbi:CHAT domain-containing protein [Streptomyces sp. NPDC058440]|uniref:CHAT domain-containing protein n=1 Tax=Streptomyces sp. NPDC058440 TaxID=3346501 RepID=UPI00365A53BB